MKVSIYSSCIALALSLTTSAALAVIDPAAETVKVSKSCTENGVALNNCFTNLTSLTDWMANTRKPGASNPLEVDIGPGTFLSETYIKGNLKLGGDAALALSCDDTIGYAGYTSFNGAGSSQTVLSTNRIDKAAIDVAYCTDMTFSNMTVNGPGYGGVTWSAGGNSKWSNVEVNAVARGWYEPGCGTSRGNHYWYSSKITVSPAYAVLQGYRATCDESWFFGSEITAILPGGEGATGTGAVVTNGSGIIHVYGSVLRSFTDGTSTVPAAKANGGEIHIHGTGIDVISATGADIVALHALNGGMIHANETAYNLVTSGGAITRIINEAATVNAPYLWPQNSDVPNITSEHGADMAVVTNTADGQPHLVIYSDNCMSQWFDTSTSSCR